MNREQIIEKIEELDKLIKEDIKKSKNNANQSGFLYYLDIVNLDLLDEKLRLLKQLTKGDKE